MKCNQGSISEVHRPTLAILSVPGSLEWYGEWYSNLLLMNAFYIIMYLLPAAILFDALIFWPIHWAKARRGRVENGALNDASREFLSRLKTAVMKQIAPGPSVQQSPFYSISYMARGGNVIGIKIGQSPLRELPAEIQDCPFLDVLLLQENQLTTLPAWLAELPKLARVNVHSNPMKQVPDVLLNMSKLRRVKLPARLRFNDLTRALKRNGVIVSTTLHYWFPLLLPCFLLFLLPIDFPEFLEAYFAVALVVVSYIAILFAVLVKKEKIYTHV